MLTCAFFNLILRIDTLSTSSEIRFVDFHESPFTISQHCFKWWLGAVRQQAMTRAKCSRSMSPYGVNRSQRVQVHHYSCVHFNFYGRWISWPFTGIHRKNVARGGVVVCLISFNVQERSQKTNLHNNMCTWMIPDDTMLAVAKVAEAHRAGNHASYILYPGAYVDQFQLCKPDWINHGVGICTYTFRFRCGSVFSMWSIIMVS